MANDRQSFRRRAQIAASGVEWDDTDWNDACDDAIDALWRTITRIAPDFRVKTTTVTITDPASNSGALPSDFMAIRTVCRSPRTQSEEYINKVGPKTGSAGFDRGWRLEDNSPTKLVLEPYETSVGSYEVKYTPQAPLLTADTGVTLDTELQQFGEFIVRHMAVSALASDESDARAQAALLAKAEADVIQWAGTQRASEPDQVEDVRRTLGRRWVLPR